YGLFGSLLRRSGSVSVIGCMIRLRKLCANLAVCAADSICSAPRPREPLLGLLAGLQEADVGERLRSMVQVPGIAGQEDRRTIVIFGIGAAVGVHELLDRPRIVRLQPPRGLIGRRLEMDRDAVFRP